MMKSGYFNYPSDYEDSLVKNKNNEVKSDIVYLKCVDSVNERDKSFSITMGHVKEAESPLNSIERTENEASECLSVVSTEAESPLHLAEYSSYCPLFLCCRSLPY